MREKQIFNIQNNHQIKFGDTETTKKEDNNPSNAGSVRTAALDIQSAARA
jgi:hypothetical protein